MHRYALVFGGILACMLEGFVAFKTGGALTIDWIGMAVLNVTAVLWMAYLAQKLRQRSAD
jgi:hypothetical protein